MKVVIYTDGAARGNPEGPGGYGAVLQKVQNILGNIPEVMCARQITGWN